MTTTGPDPREMSAMLADDIERVLETLGLGIRRRTRRLAVCASPASGKPKLEVQIYPMAGKWNDWSEGRYGDALGLVAYAIAGEPKGAGPIKAAMDWARSYFGFSDQSWDDEAWKRRREEARARQAAAERTAARELAQNRRTAQGLWLGAHAIEEGDIAWSYFQARGIDFKRLTRAPRAIRWMAAAPWREEGADEPSHVGPALLAAMTLPDGKFGSLHRTWLDPDQPGKKAALDPPRKMWPESRGAAIRVWRGSTGLTETEAGKRGVVEDLVLCEGLEDALSIAIMTPELRVVAAGSLSGLGAYTPPKFVRKVIIAADNDWGKPAAARQLEAACSRLAQECGKLVSVARSPVGKDFNDLLRGE